MGYPVNIRVRVNLGAKHQYFPRISSPFYFLAFLGSLCFSTNQANTIYVFAGVLIPAKKKRSSRKQKQLGEKHQQRRLVEFPGASSSLGHRPFFFEEYKTEADFLHDEIQETALREELRKSVIRSSFQPGGSTGLVEFGCLVVLNNFVSAFKGMMC